MEYPPRPNPVPGCGKHGLELTLYQVPAQGQPAAIFCRPSDLPCGFLLPKLDAESYSILLCDACSDRHRFPRIA